MTLKEFAYDKQLVTDVQRYIQAFLDLKALELLYERKDVSKMADAKDILDGAFEQLDTDFSPKIKPKTENLDNAR